MPIAGCPGQDKRFWKASDIQESPCPHCGSILEFWKDDARRRCPSCGRQVANPSFDMGCAKWCKYATACLGQPTATSAGSGQAAATEEALCDTLIREMKTVFGDDRRRIAHALEVLDHAEKIMLAEGGDPLVIRAAAVLHDIGIREAERKHGSNAGHLQELEGPPIASPILERLGIDPERRDHILRIIANHHTRPSPAPSAGSGQALSEAERVDTPEFRILWDADRIANIPEECERMTPDQARAFVARAYLTPAGRTMGAAAVERFLVEWKDV
jgi:hypothetical protein